jgi:hypothetical protein
MGYLLVLDAMRDEDYQNAAEVFIKRAEANNKEKSILYQLYRKSGSRNYQAIKKSPGRGFYVS